MSQDGLIEGFYGPPWTWAQRERMVDLLAAEGLALYLYAPKNDRLHRSAWREPYLPEELHRFERLASRARARGVELVFGLSPLAVRFGQDREWRLIVEKLASLAERGVRSFCLLFDDIPHEFSDPADVKRFESLAAAQAWLTGTAFEELRGRFSIEHLSFVPTEYSGRPDTPYLRTLGAQLPAEIEIFWTGPEVCSERIEVAHIAEVASVLRRPPLIWDNYPVNDGAMADGLRLRPLAGRESRLPGAVGGILVNGALQAEVSGVALCSLGAYLRDPTGYRPKAVALPALVAVAGDQRDAEVLEVIADLCRRSPIDRATPTRFAIFAEGWWADWTNARPSARSGLLERVEREVARLRATADHLLGALTNRRLAAEVRPWARKLRTWTDALASALAALVRFTDEAPTAANEAATAAIGRARRAALRALGSAQRDPHQVDDRTFELFARRCLSEASR